MNIEDIIRKIVRSELEPVVKELRQAIESLKEHRKKTVYLTRDEATERLKISLPTLDKHIKEGRILTKKVGKRILIPEDQLNYFFNRI